MSEALGDLDERRALGKIVGAASWRRRTVPAMLAHAFLSVPAASRPHTTTAAPTTDPSVAGPISLTRNEIRRTLTGLTTEPRWTAFRFGRSRWHRHHQAVARACDFKRRTAQTH